MQPTLHAHFTIVTALFPHNFNKLFRGWSKGGFSGECSRGRLHFQRESPPRPGAPHLFEGELGEGLVAGTIVLFGARIEWSSLLEPFREESVALLLSIHAAIDPACTEADRHLDPPIADPSLDGAEIASPVSLLASPSRDRVRFTLPGPWRARSDRSRSEVSVTSGGVALEGDWHRESIGWDRLGGAVLAAQGGASYLLLFDPAGRTVARLGCAGSPDDDWLALYLDAQIARRRPPVEERERDARERARALALLGEAQRPLR